MTGTSDMRVLHQIGYCCMRLCFCIGHPAWLAMYALFGKSDTMGGVYWERQLQGLLSNTSSVCWVGFVQQVSTQAMVTACVYMTGLLVSSTEVSYDDVQGMLLSGGVAVLTCQV